MRNLGTRWSLAMCVTAAVLLTSCSSNPTAPKVALSEPGDPADRYPPIPRPTSPSEVTPDTSESYYTVAPIAGKRVDFAPTWSEGVFTWHIDVQTLRKVCGIPDCQWTGYPPGPYWDGTARNTALVFEGGQVDLRSPEPFQNATRRLQFVSAGWHLDSPVNPDMHPNQVVFGYAPTGGTGQNPPHVYQALFGGSRWLDKEPHFLEAGRAARYQLAALSCPKLTNPVFLRRQRFWKRVPLTGQGGGSLKSVIIDPGAIYSVQYTRVQGVDHNVSNTFTRTISAEVGASTPAEVAGFKLGGSLSDAFSTSVTSHQETSETETQTFNGKDGQTVVYSVWTTVERYTFVDKDGNPFTDPNFTFADLGTAEILGDFERLLSTSFPYGSAPQTSATKAEESISRLNPKQVTR